MLGDDVIELRLLRVLGPDEAGARSPESRFLSAVPECRFAIHRRGDGERVGRIHLRLTDNPTIVGVVGHSGYEIDEPHRRQGYASRALVLILGVARHYGVAPLRVLIAPEVARPRARPAALPLRDD